MGREAGAVYVLCADDGGDWMSPTPVDAAVADALTAGTDLDVDDLDDLATYVDVEDLRAVLEDGERETAGFEVEGHDVTVHADGSIEVG